ncbi:SDR family NAD(P)-dependent oxidoreductase, partial [Tepidiforma sp.]|uniref:SDR family NAD(P)-dependent oxidoreductase n=1 Tax=Tepidiforma sp. TaxID=2682230 RepID=UPI002604DBD7
MFSLDGKVALVTGASSGLGVAFARGLARAGANVVVTARRQELIEQTASMLREFGVEAEAYPADITDEEQFEQLFARTVERFGRLDIMVNNAGYTDRSGLRHDLGSFKRMRSVVELDLLATINGCRLAARQMLAQGTGGVIINISSILGRVGSEFRAASYHAAKGGVDALTRVLALEYAREGIRVNAIAPSYFDGTELMGKVFESTPGTRVQAESRTPMGRLGQPEDLEGAIIYLASDAAKFVTGHILYV